MQIEFPQKRTWNVIGRVRSRLARYAVKTVRCFFDSLQRLALACGRDEGILVFGRRSPRARTVYPSSQVVSFAVNAAAVNWPGRRIAQKKASLVSTREASIGLGFCSTRLLHEEVCWAAERVIRILVYTSLRWRRWIHHATRSVVGVRVAMYRMERQIDHLIGVMRSIAAGALATLA